MTRAIRLGAGRAGILLVTICFIGGCGPQSDRWQWGGSRARPIRESSRRSPANGAEETAAPEEANTGFYQLILLSGADTGPAAEDLHELRLERAKADDVGDLMIWLYPPAGPVGTEKRYTLIYPTEYELGAAARTARSLDVTAADIPLDSVPESPSEVFTAGLSLLYGTPSGADDERVRLGLVRDCMMRAGESAELDAKQRWEAWIIAGQVCLTRLGEYETAEQCFRAASEGAPAGALEHLAGRYALAMTLRQNGEPDRAREELSQALAGAEAWRSTETYRRGQELLDELAGNRGR
jgi:hypothetical protein